MEKGRRDFIKISSLSAAGLVFGGKYLQSSVLSSQNNQFTNFDTSNLSRIPTYCEVCFWKCAGWVYKNEDGKMFYSGDERNEMTVDRDIMVLANPEIADLPAWVVALVAAGGVAAALSTSAGLLLVISTSISHDLLKRTLTPNITDKQELLWARVAAAVAIALSTWFGINPPGFVAQVVAFAFGLAAASFFPAIILGIFYKKMNSQGAIAGMLVGIVFTLAYIIYFKFVNPAANNADNWLFGISPEGIGTIGMLLNFIVSYVVHKITGDAPQDTQDLVESIRYPRGAGGATH